MGRLLDGGCGPGILTLRLAHLFEEAVRLDDFAAEVRELLAARSPDGVFWDWPGDTEVVLAVRS